MKVDYLFAGNFSQDSAIKDDTFAITNLIVLPAKVTIFAERFIGWN